MTLYSLESTDRILNIKPKFWLALALPFLICALLAMFVFRQPIQWVDAINFFAFYQIALFGVSVANHRYYSHRSFKARKAFRYFLFLCSAIAFQTPGIAWGAIHRKHHQFTDRSIDPHSPWVLDSVPIGFWRGWWHAHFTWIFRLNILEEIKKYAPDLYQDSELISFQKWHVSIGFFFVVLPGVLEGLYLQSIDGFWRGLFWGGFFRIFVLHNALFLVNSIAGHSKWGYRNFETPDHSQNSYWMFPLVLGEAWHNNHHRNPALATTKIKSFEWDPHFNLLCFLEKINVLYDLKKHES